MTLRAVIVAGALGFAGLAALAAQGARVTRSTCAQPDNGYPVIKVSGTGVVKTTCTQTPLSTHQPLTPTETVTNVSSTNPDFGFATPHLTECDEYVGSTDQLTAKTSPVALVHLNGETWCRRVSGDASPIQVVVFKTLGKTHIRQVHNVVGGDVIGLVVNNGQMTVFVERGSAKVDGVPVGQGHQDNVPPLAGATSAVMTFTPNPEEANTINELEYNVIASSAQQVLQYLGQTNESSVVLVGVDSTTVAAEAQTLKAAGIQVQVVNTTDPAAIDAAVTQSRAANSGTSPAVVLVGSLPNGGQTALKDISSTLAGASPTTSPKTSVLWVQPKTTVVSPATAAAQQGQ
jgi:hypothetical protein